MNRILIILFMTLSTSVGWAQLQAHTLGAESLYNNKTFLVENLNQSNGIEVKIRTVNRGEPAMFPVYLYPYIKCGKRAVAKPMDLAAEMTKSYPSSFSNMIGGPAKGFRSGVLHVCAIENVNFDSEKIFITIFESGSEGCDRTKVLDLIFPIEVFCKK